MASKHMSERDILEIDDCAPALADIPGVLQVYAGYGRQMNRLPEVAPDGSLLILMDVADSFMARCLAVFEVQKFPCEYASLQPPPDKIERPNGTIRRSLAKRSVMRLRIAKVGRLLSSGYRTALHTTAGGAIFKFVEYDAPSPPDIVAYLKTALR